MLNYPDLEFDWLNNWANVIDEKKAMPLKATLDLHSLYIQNNINGYEIDLKATLSGFNQACKEWALSLLNSNNEERTAEFEQFFDIDVATAYSERLRLNKIENERNKALQIGGAVYMQKFSKYPDLEEAKTKAKIQRIETFNSFGLTVNDENKKLVPTFDVEDQHGVHDCYLAPLGDIVLNQDPVFLTRHLLDHPIFLKWFKTFARDKCKNDGTGTCQCWTPTGRGLTSIMTALAYLNFIYLIQNIQNEDANGFLDMLLNRVKRINDCFSVLSAAFDVDLQTSWRQQIETDSASRVASENAKKSRKAKAHRYIYAKKLTTEIFKENHQNGQSNTKITDLVYEKYYTLSQQNMWNKTQAKPNYDTIKNKWIPKLRNGESLS